jgi:hypothetical protein
LWLVGWWLTWAHTKDGKEERLARLTAEKIEKMHTTHREAATQSHANFGTDHVFSD